MYSESLQLMYVETHVGHMRQHETPSMFHASLPHYGQIIFHWISEGF